MKRIFAAVVFGIIAATSLVGCNDNGNDSFVGHWVENVTIEGKKPAQLDIALVDGGYQISEVIRVAGESITSHEIGRAETKSVISVKNGLRNIQLSNGNIIYRNMMFVKQPLKNDQEG